MVKKNNFLLDIALHLILNIVQILKINIYPDKAKLIVRWGRKASGLNIMEIAGLPIAKVIRLFFLSDKEFNFFKSRAKANFFDYNVIQMIYIDNRWGRQ